MSHMWDLEDPRLLVCEAKSLHSKKKQRDNYMASEKEERVSTSGNSCTYLYCIRFTAI